MTNGRDNGRVKLGSIYVWAAGNGGASDNSNYDGYANSRFVIAVSASTNTGQEPSSYAEEGANVRLNAPSGGGTLGITTTDLTGAEGPDPGNYRHDFGGTSAAAPLVSGIIALMLQANPNLTWRDVQHILMTTAEKNDPFDPEWTTNGAGFHVNYKFGFGRINAQAAVSAAHGKLGSDGYAGPAAGPATGSSSPALSIPDNNQTGVSDTITIPGSDNFFVEFVEVYFTATHDRWPDLEITLTSPQGTKSVLARSHSPRSWSGDYTNWRFGSVRHFGEFSAGDWTLTVKDLRSDITGVFNSWSLKIYGFSRRLPWVGLVYPANNAAGVPLNTVVTAVFSKDMNPLSLKDTFHLRRGGVDDVPGLVVYDQATKKATFTPAAALDNGSIYTAVIDSSAQDQDGQTLSAAYAWTFTTGGGGGGCFIRTLK